MQFSHDAYSKNGLPTIMPKNNISIPIEMLGRASWPSKQDYVDLNLYYCGETIEVKHKTPLCTLRIRSTDYRRVIKINGILI